MARKLPELREAKAAEPGVAWRKHKEARERQRLTVMKLVAQLFDKLPSRERAILANSLPCASAAVASLN